MDDQRKRLRQALDSIQQARNDALAIATAYQVRIIGFSVAMHASHPLHCIVNWPFVSCS